jgi:CRISPR system Cascade subunit CasA
VHALQVYWATPRRIRLQFSYGVPVACAICANRTEVSVASYLTKNYGLNYKGPWRHPLSPYYRNKPTEALLPVHPQPDGLTYRHWLGWALGSRRAGREIVQAAAVRAFSSTRVQYGQVRLWAFGYDMDNMKARCWYETTFPLFDLPVGTNPSAESAELIVAMVEPLIAAAEAVAQDLRFAVRDAWFGKGEARGDLGFVEASLWNRTEREFFARVEQAIALCREHGRAAFDQTEPLRRGWLDTLRRSALRLFDEVAASGAVEAGNPAKLAAAHRALRGQLDGDKLLAALGLIAAVPPGAAGRSRRSGGKSNKPSLEAR